MNTAIKNIKVKKSQWPALIFLTIVCFIFLSATAGITYMILNSTNKELELRVERILLTKTHQKVSELSTWYGTLTSQVRILSNSDFLRLFTYEATQNFSNYAEMLELSQTQSIENAPLQMEDKVTVTTEDEYNKAQIPEDVDNKINLAQQLPVINKNLQDFVDQSNFLSAYVYNPSFEVFAASGDKISEPNEMQKALMKKAAEQDSFVLSNAYHTENMNLIIDMIQPIRLPAYIEEDKEQIIGFLLISLDISSAIAHIIENNSAEDKITYWIIQQDGDKLIRLSVKEGDHLVLSDEWQINESNQVNFGIRALDTSQSGYSLALNVPHSSWLVVANLSVADANEIFYGSNELILFIIGIIVLSLLLLITFAWWWLVGQKERKASFEIGLLYSTIEKQKTLLENVNSNVQDGIVMKDRSGVILYANDAFARIMQVDLENIIGSDLKNIFIGKTNMPVNPYISEVLNTGTPRTYTEMIQIADDVNYFQVSYSPYKTEGGEISGIVGIYGDITNLIVTQNNHQLMSKQLIRVLKRTVEAFDPYLKGHSTQLGHLATVLAYMHNLDEEQVNVINSAAALSQIGVIQLPLELRAKTTAFSAEDRLLLETHIELAKNILDDIKFGLPIQNVIYQMYEKLDGTGYPNKLKGEEISIESRILSVSNTFCAILRPRAHRGAHGLSHALQILSPNNSAYDKDIVNSLHLWLKGHEGQDFVQRLEQT